MKFIPFQRVTITTTLSKEEVVSRLKQRVGPRERKNFVRVDKNIFSGQVTPDQFQLMLLTEYRNSWSPTIKGSIAQLQETTELQVTFQVNWFLISATLCFMILGLSLTIIELMNFSSLRDFPWINVAFIIVPYGLFLFGFNVDTARTIDELIQLTNGSITS